MIRFLLRTAGFVLLAAAFAALVVDGSRSIAGERLMQYRSGEALSWLVGARFDAALQGSAAWPPAVRSVVIWLLAIPGWAAAGALGLLLRAAGRPRAGGTAFLARRR